MLVAMLRGKRARAAADEAMRARAHEQMEVEMDNGVLSDLTVFGLD